MKIKFKLLLGFLIMVLFVLIVGLLSINSIKNINKSVDSTRDIILYTDASMNMLIEMRTIELLTMEIIASSDMQDMNKQYARYTQSVKEFETNLEFFKKSDKKDYVEEAILAEKYFIQMTDKTDQIYEVVKRKHNGEKNTGGIIFELDTDHEVIAENLNQVLVDLEETNFKLSETIEQDAEDIVKSSLILIIIIVIICTILAILVGLYLVYIITKPLSNLQEASKKMSEGDLTIKLDSKLIKQKDEIGSLAVSFTMMIENLRQMISTISQNAQSSASAAEELTASSEEVNASSEQVSATVQEIAKGGQTLSKSVSNTKQDTENLINMINSVSSASKDASKSAEISKNIAEKGSEAAKEASKKIELINTSVSEASDLVTALGVKTNEITSVIKVINTISDQTNLLALNAAIEAARAGDAGRGFAVVADEVRKLAEETRKATKQIDVMINDMIERTNVVVTSMHKGKDAVSQGNIVISDALASLELISNNITNLAGQIEMITSSALIQKESSLKVQKSIEEVSGVAEESAASSEEASASVEEISTAMQQVATSSQNLSKTAADLNNIVKQFKL